MPLCLCYHSNQVEEKVRGFYSLIKASSEKFVGPHYLQNRTGNHFKRAQVEYSIMKMDNKKERNTCAVSCICSTVQHFVKYSTSIYTIRTI